MVEALSADCHSDCIVSDCIRDSRIVNMKKEFPNFTIRQGLSSQSIQEPNAEVEQQVTKPLKSYIFSYKEVKKTRTQINHQAE